MKNKKSIIIITVGVLVLLATAPWMNKQAVHDRVFNEKAKIDGSINKKTGELICDYDVSWFPFGRIVSGCEGGYFVPFFYFKKENNDNAQKQQIHENNKVATENADWKTYKNEKYGFELDFPESWKGYELTIKEYPQWTEMCFAIADKEERSYCIFQIIVYTKEQWVSFKEKYPGAKDVKENNQNNKYMFKYEYTTDNSSYEECESVQLSKFQCDRSREVPQILSTFKFTE